jgi:hypothetical protein
MSISSKVAIAIILFPLVFCSCSKKSAPLAKNSEVETLLDNVQRQTIDYMWKGGEPTSGAAPERIHMDNDYPMNDQQIVTSGGTGFGIMALVAGIDRGFIPRQEGVARLTKLTNWLEKAERFHGAWPHWMKPTGAVQPFSQFDDGGDLVETAYLAQGLITAREYFKNGNSAEKAMTAKMDQLWKGIDWQWYTNGGQEVLYWHWSPKHQWKMNFAVRGYNECLIMYVMAAASPTHPIKPEAYHQGFMRGGKIVTDAKMYDIPTILDHYETENIPAGPLFWSQYSHLGLDPRNLKDKYADWWLVNKNHTQIHYEHALRNPKGYKGYGKDMWGLTSSYSMIGYAGHNPSEDLGVISPTAGLSAIVYMPNESIDFLKNLYANHTDKIGAYGPYDAFSIHHNWMKPHYLAIDQLPIPVMIENHRSGLLWKLFMQAPEVKNGLGKLGFRVGE